MKKIAFVSGWYVQQHSQQTIQENHRLLLDYLYASAKKHFLPNHDVEFIFLTNGDIEIEGVTNIKFNYTFDGFWHMCLMKILSLKYLEDKYDYVFVNDTDQIYTDTVGDEILEKDMTILEHYYWPLVKGIHDEITDRVPLTFDTTKERWTMGNFFGGKMKNMIELLDLSQKWHDEYNKPPFHEDFHFYSRYPEELFLVKYIFENNIEHKRLGCITNPMENTTPYFQGDFQEDESIYPNFKNVKVLHNTKKNYQTLKNIIKFYI